MRTLIISIAAALVVAAPASAHPAQAGPTRAAHCTTEDSPGWNWVRCGNHRRGIAIRTTNQYGDTIYRIKVVTKTSYCRYWRESKIDSSLTVRLHGDPTPSQCSPHLR